MRILVAGGAGYVGSVLVPSLQERGYDVTVVDTLWFGNRLPAGTRVVQRDVMRLSARDLEGYDQVIFVAGISNDPMAEWSPGANFVANSALPTYLAYVAKRAGVRRFIYGGSCSVYGCAGDALLDESSPTACTFPYGIAKPQGEVGVSRMADEHFSVVALRKGTVCGYSPRMRLDLVVNTMFMTAVRDRVIRVSNPAVWRPVLAIRDAVAAYVAAVECGADVSGTFNVASGNYTLGALGECVRAGVEACFGAEVRVETGCAADPRSYRVSVDRARRVLRFAPRWSVPDIVRELARHRRAFGSFDDDWFYNIAVLRRLDPCPAAV